MRKMLFLLVLCSVTLYSCKKDNAISDNCDVRKHGLKGNVRYVHESCYWAEETSYGEYKKGDQTAVARMVDTFERYFNQQGNIEKVVSSYRIVDDDTYYCTFYDENNRVIKKQRIGVNKKSKKQEIYSETLFTYDVMGRLIQEEEGNNSIYYTYQNEMQNSLCVQEDSRYDGELKHRSVMKYDGNGFLSERIELYFNKEGGCTLGSIKGFLNNGKGQVIKASTYDNYAEVLEEESYSYDEYGRVIEIQCKHQDGQSVEKKRYDSNGNIVENMHYYNDEYQQGYKYQYKIDHEGNWVEKVILEDIDGDRKFAPNIIEVREISYY